MSKGSVASSIPPRENPYDQRVSGSALGTKGRRIFMILRSLLRGLVSFVVITFVLVPALAGQDMTVGADNELTFETPVKVGQTILRPGTYRFEHIVMSDHHIIKLTPTRMSKDSHEVSVQCKLESAGTPSKFTVLHFEPGKNAKTLHYVLVAGESAKHRL
jgi:hypothetical protein